MDNTNNNNRKGRLTAAATKKKISASMSKKSSPSQVSSKSSPIPIAQASPTTIICSSEEVWKDICLPSTTTSLHHPTTTTTDSSTSGMFFQEFLASNPPNRTTNRGPVSSWANPQHSPTHHHHHHQHSCCKGARSGIFGSHFQSHPGLDPAAATLLSLNSLSPDDYPLTSKAPIMPSYFHPQDDIRVLDSSITTVEFSILPNKSVIPYQILPKTRVPDQTDDKTSSSGHKNKRMIKNRESAARSRARKQAYTNELEEKVDRLMEENAKLKEQHEKLCLTAPAQTQFPKKTTLSRTLTAPF